MSKFEEEKLLKLIKELLVPLTPDFTACYVALHFAMNTSVTSKKEEALKLIFRQFDAVLLSYCSAMAEGGTDTETVLTKEEQVV